MSKPPTLPNRLSGHDAPANHAAGRDGFAALLTRLAGPYGRPAWKETAAPFEQSGQVLEKMTDATVDFILGESDTLEPVAELITGIANLEEQAYGLIVEER